MEEENVITVQLSELNGFESEVNGQTHVVVLSCGLEECRFKIPEGTAKLTFGNDLLKGAKFL